MLTTILEGMLAASAATSLLQLGCTAWALAKGSRKATRGVAHLPPVSILKPLKGVDDGLMDNLESFCNLDYPEFEIVFCLQSPSDPALRVVRKVAERHPGCDIRVVIGHCFDGMNPKVNNMIPGYLESRHPFVLISDSNVRVRPDYLRKAIVYFADPEVGMVNHLVRGIGARTLGARLENGHLNGFILGSIATMDGMFDLPCVVGKSMLMRKTDLGGIGGLHEVRDFLAEDYVLGRLVRKAGKRIVISADAVDNVNRYRTIREFLSRHARWNRMRLAIAGPGYLSEIFANPVFFALLLLLASGGSREATMAAGAVVLCKFGTDLAMGMLLGAPDALRLALAGPLRDLMVAGIWFSAFFSRTVTWRGRVLRITRRSRLVPVGETSDAGIFGARPGTPKEVAA